MKALLFFFLFYTSLQTYAQNYTFSIGSGTYQNLTNSISLNNGTVWDDPSYEVPIGFNFQIGSYSFDTLYFSASGGMLLTNQNLQGVGMVIGPFVLDLEDRGWYTGVSQSPLSYKLIGQPGNRILKIEWNNTGFWNDTTVNDFTNFQVWLHEGTYEVSYHYGPSSINNPDETYEGYTGPRVMFSALLDFDTNTALGSFFELFGDPLNPTTNNPANNWDALHQMIPDGTIYTFSPDNLSIETSEEKEFIIYPNPASNYLTIQLNESVPEKYDVIIFNNLGQKVRSFTKVETSKLNISGLPAGLFFVTVETQEKSITQKLLVK